MVLSRDSLFKNIWISVILSLVGYECCCVLHGKWWVSCVFLHSSCLVISVDVKCSVSAKWRSSLTRPMWWKLFPASVELTREFCEQLDALVGPQLTLLASDICEQYNINRRISGSVLIEKKVQLMIINYGAREGTWLKNFYWESELYFVCTK